MPHEVDVPVEVEVLPWRVPSGLEFQTDVMFEQSPYALAKHYKVPLWSDEHFRLIETSFKQLARAGNDELFIPVLTRTEFGNVEQPGMIKWKRKPDGALAFDYTVLDKYLDLAVKHLGKVRVISFVIMHWQMASAPPTVVMFDEAAGKEQFVPMGWRDGAIDRMPMWKAFASAVVEHMRSKGLGQSVYWGHGGDHESDPPLIMMVNELFPDIYWTAAPHTWHGASNGGGHNPKLFKAVSEVYGPIYSETSMKGWVRRNDDKFLNFRCDRGLGGLGPPYYFRDLADQAIRGGHTGIGRMGFDYFDLTWNEGYLGADWNPPGQPFFMFSWPGKTAVESSTRFETMLEGIQQAEARIFLEQAIERKALPGALALFRLFRRRPRRCWTAAFGKKRPARAASWAPSAGRSARARFTRWPPRRPIC